MPQLVKGGKYVFGWSVVNADGKIKIPQEAFMEYNFKKGEAIVIMQASNTSGGIIVSRVEKLAKSALKRVVDIIYSFEDNNDIDFDINDVITDGKKVFLKSVMQANNYIQLSNNALLAFKIPAGTNLLAIRGSNLGLSFIMKGPIIEEANKHNNIKWY